MTFADELAAKWGANVKSTPPGFGKPMRLALTLMALLTLNACGGQQAIDASRLKMSVDAADTYKSAKVGLGQPF